MARKPKNKLGTIATLDRLQTQLSGLDRRLAEFELQQAMTNYQANAWLNGYRQVLEHCTSAIVELTKECQAG